MSSTELRKLGAFGRQVRDKIGSRRELNLLDQIDETVERLADETVRIQSLALMNEHFIEALQKCTITKQESIEALAKVESMFEKCIELTAEYYSDQVARRQGAVDDPRLTEEDGVVEGYDALLQEISALHNNLSTLNWIIREHIAEADVTLPGTFESADALFEAMGV